jgi:hypothetical protein
VIPLTNVKLVLLVALALLSAISGGGFFDDVLVWP